MHAHSARSARYLYSYRVPGTAHNWPIVPRRRGSLAVGYPHHYTIAEVPF